MGDVILIIIGIAAVLVIHHRLGILRRDTMSHSVVALRAGIIIEMKGIGCRKTSGRWALGFNCTVIHTKQKMQKSKSTLVQTKPY